MTPPEQERFAQEIFLRLVPLINFTAPPAQMDAEANATISRSRNLAKLWAAKAERTLPTIEELTKQAEAYRQEFQDRAQQAETTQDDPVRRKPGRPARQ